MNIDKFGHHVHKRLRLPDLSDISLLRAENGEIDLKLTRLKGVKIPSFPDDAVNKQYVDQKLKEFYSKHDVDLELKNIKTQMQVIINQLKPKLPPKAELKLIHN